MQSTASTVRFNCTLIGCSFSSCTKFHEYRLLLRCCDCLQCASWSEVKRYMWLPDATIFFSCLHKRCKQKKYTIINPFQLRNKIINKNKKSGRICTTTTQTQCQPHTFGKTIQTAIFAKHETNMYTLDTDHNVTCSQFKALTHRSPQSPDSWCANTWWLNCKQMKVLQQ